MIRKYNKHLCALLWALFFLSFSFVCLMHLAEIYGNYQDSIKIKNGETLGLFSCGNAVTGPMLFILNVNIPVCLLSTTLLLLNSLLINKRAGVMACFNALCLSGFLLITSFNKLYEYAVHSLAGEPVFSSVWWWFFDSIAQ